MLSTDPTWFKDAIFYEVRIGSYADTNGDGIGDFRGLTEKLDYLQYLGVDCIWILPMYPSPMRDDGYDISDFYSIHPNYGTVEDFEAFVAAAHDRGIRVIADLVLNHTSSDHAWFQEARRDPTSKYRGYYVWSDTDTRYAKTRIIFIDSELSNWTWDEEAKQFYWHRFFWHQPDLNYDNDETRTEMLNVMRYWMAKGLDGFRCDAVPYLYEEEGTNNENLPQTHGFLRELRMTVDNEFPNQGKILLGEANQWPHQVVEYFGTAEAPEFQINFHFPLMPRLYIALARQDRTPIVDVLSLETTPPIPPGCQWAVFLRNHDELTLEMLGHEDRELLWQTYAPDPRMPLNLGIRRRLAPLLENDRRRIELMNSLLFSLPGTPVLYYGDEIGMGDDLAQPDRNGVRTPMQWSAAPHGGFTTGTPAIPAIADETYGYQTINVEAQRGDPRSLLEWMRRLIAVRKQYRAFGRGRLSFLFPPGRSLLTYIRHYPGQTVVEEQVVRVSVPRVTDEETPGETTVERQTVERRVTVYRPETILCVANLSPQPQTAVPHLPRFRGWNVLDIVANEPLAPVASAVYPVELGPYGFRWLLLSPPEPPTTEGMAG